MTTKLGKIVANVGERWWGQVHDYVPTGQHVVRGRLVAAVSFEAEEEVGQVQMVETGREILARLHELYYGGEQKGPFEGLKETLRQMGEEYPQIEVAALVAVNGVVYVSCIRGAVWVSIEGKEGWVVRSDGEVKSASGPERNGEILVAGNERFWRSVPPGFLRAAAKSAESDLEGAVETLAAVEHGAGEKGGEVGVIVKLEGEGQVVVEKPVVEENREVMPIINPKREFKINWPRWGDGWKKFLPGSRQAVYVEQGDKTGPRRRTMAVGLGFVIMLLVIVALGRIKVKNETLKSSGVQQKVEDVVYQFNQAQSLVGINDVRSRQLLTQIKGEIKDLETQKIKDSRITEIAAKIDQLVAAAEGIKNTPAEEILDLTLIRDGLSGDKIVALDGYLYVLDVSGSRLVKVNISKKSGDVVSGKSVIGAATKIAQYPGKIELVNSDGVIEVDEEGKGGKQVLARDEKWQSVTSVGMYGGNLYVLDAQAGKIWRHSGTANGFGKASDWLDSDSGGVAGQISMTIDGSIWTMGQGVSSVKKFTRGTKENIALESLDQDVGNGAMMYTNDDAANVYVLDPNNGRVVVWKKTGEYVEQAVMGELKGAKDFTVDEKTQKIYFVSGNGVWGAGL